MLRRLAKSLRPFARGFVHGGFGKDHRGAVAVEYAFILPILLLFTFGILEISLCMASLVTLEGGLKQASRFGITSQLPTDADVALVAAQVPTAFAAKDNRTKMIMAILNMNTLDLIDLNTATITTQTFTSFSAVANGEPYTDANLNGVWDAGESFSDTNCNGVRDGPGAASGGGGASGNVGTSGNIVVYTVNYNWKIITPMVGPYLGQVDPSRPGKYMIPMSAQMVVKNEPNLSGSSFCK